MPFFDVETVQAKTLAEGVQLKSVYGEKIMMSFFDLEPGAEVPEHRHEHEQMGMVISGELELTIGDETKVCRTGDTYLVPSNVLHRGKIVNNSPAKVLDIFSPPRQEYK